ncbi:MAG: TylF/MycF/NovP-related O-methyltransferase [Bdellovibrionales bacterium]
MHDIGLRIHEVEDRRTFFRKAWCVIAHGQITGDYVEFGSYSGLTFGLAYQEALKINHKPHLWTFDSFKGLPNVPQGTEHPLWKPGAMATDLRMFLSICDHQGLPREQYTIVEGFYEHTLTPQRLEKAGYPTDVAMVYVDCDMYASTVHVMNFLKGRLKHGMIIAFDDWFCPWPGDIAGERKAFLEFAETQTQFHFQPYLQFGWSGYSFIVEDKKFLPKNYKGDI